MAIAQDPHEAEYDGMSRSAIATGSVDLVLPIAEMMPQILEFGRTHPLITPGSDEVLDSKAGEAATDPLQTALTLVRLRTGHDFLRYKRSTVARRVSRRMQILNIETLQDYVELLRNDTQESATLLDDLLINVTSFFRDAEVFRALETDVIPSLFEGRERGEAIRVWSVGCATGEEAYTLAMLLLEEAGRRTSPPQVQVFATDLHEPSLQYGREALFSEMIEAEISPERLERFFRKESGGYRVMKELRDIVVFASHNLLRDPPFSKQDLIVCRNLLIYLQRDVQEEVVHVFHYALRPGGRLLLGTAEILDRSELFAIESKPTHSVSPARWSSRCPAVPRGTSAGIAPFCRTGRATVAHPLPRRDTAPFISACWSATPRRASWWGATIAWSTSRTTPGATCSTRAASRRTTCSSSCARNFASSSALPCIRRETSAPPGAHGPSRCFSTGPISW